MPIPDIAIPNPDTAATMARPPNQASYVGRFAPSATGPLHLGSIVAALASWLDARAHSGRWLVRIEDIDQERCRPEYVQKIRYQLDAFGLISDAKVTCQSNNHAAHLAALHKLQDSRLVFACVCSRAAIAALEPRIGASGEPVYPSTCRGGAHSGTVRAWRMRVDHATISYADRWMGAQSQELASECGDFVVARGDGAASYHLASVVDDAAAGVTHVVRGDDLAPLTARQIFLQRALGLPTPSYMHVPVLTDESGAKLSKQNGAPAADASNTLTQLQLAWKHLGFEVFDAQSIGAFLPEAAARWRRRFLSA